MVLNDEIHYAREAQKMNTTQLDAFRSPNRGRAGVMNMGKFLSFFKAHHTAQQPK